MKDHCFKYICCTAAAILAAFLQTLPVYALDAKAQDDDGFTVIMVGDILLHDGIEKCAKQEDGSYDFSEIFRHTKDVIEKADLAIVNEEVIIGGEDLRVSGYPNFNAPYEIADDLADTG